MSTPAVVLVHSPLVGPLTWQHVADELRRRGHTVVLPRLDNPDDVSVPLQRHHAERIRRSVEAEVPGSPVVLVAHSGAGAILPLAGETLVNEVAGYILVDAELPRDGVSRLETAPPGFVEQLERLARSGRVPPWAEWWNEAVVTALLPDDDLREAFLDELEPLPLRLFDEPNRVPASWPDAPCGFLRLSGTYDEPAAEAARRGWETAWFEAGHLHMLVDPPGVAEALEELTRRLAGGEPPPKPADPPVPLDPIAAQRVRIRSWVDLGRRVGVLALAVAILLFTVALYWGLPGILVQLVIASLVIATVTLLPSIIVGFGLAAAEREDETRRRGGTPPV